MPKVEQIDTAFSKALWSHRSAHPLPNQHDDFLSGWNAALAAERERLAKVTPEMVDNLGPFDFYVLRQENYSGEHREWREQITLPAGSYLTREIVAAYLAIRNLGGTDA